MNDEFERFCACCCMCVRVCVCVKGPGFQQLITLSVISSKEEKGSKEKDVLNEWRQEGRKSAQWLISQCRTAFNAFADRASEFA